MGASEVISWVVWIIIAVLICVGSVLIGVGSFNQPGPGLFPFLIGCAIVVISFPQAVIGFFRESGNFRDWEHIAELKGVIAIIVILSFYALFLKHLGFFLCTFFFFIMIFKAVGLKSWIYAVLNALIISILSYMVFVVCLRINLPKGLLGIVGT